MGFCLLLLILKVAYLQAQLMQAKAQLAQTLMESGGNMELQWTGSFNNNLSNGIPSNYETQIMNPAVSPQSSVESAANNDAALMFMNHYQESQTLARRRSASCHGDLGELQALALRMMRN